MAFTDFTGLSVNDTALNVKLGNVTLLAMIQNKLYHDGVGITEVFSADASYGGAILRVPKITNASGNYRTFGATTNGGFFNSNSATVATLTEEVIYCKHVYDEMEDVPEAQHVLSLAGASAVGIRAERIGRQIAKGMNAGTMAYQLAAVINAVIAASGTETGRIETYTISNGDEALIALLNVGTYLDDGDTYNDYFPTQGRLCLARPNFIKNLKRKGAVIVGGSNFAQEMRQSGALDRNLDVLPELAIGYQGTVNNVPIFLASAALWTEAEVWLGQSAGYLDNIDAIVCAYNATGRGYAFPEQMKVIDSPSGVGLRLQPLANFGVKVFFEKGIKLIAKATFAEGSTALTVEAPDSQA